MKKSALLFSVACLFAASALPACAVTAEDAQDVDTDVDTEASGIHRARTYSVSGLFVERTHPEVDLSDPEVWRGNVDAKPVDIPLGPTTFEITVVRRSSKRLTANLKLTSPWSTETFSDVSFRLEQAGFGPGVWAANVNGFRATMVLTGRVPVLHGLTYTKETAPRTSVLFLADGLPVSSN